MKSGAANLARPFASISNICRRASLPWTRLQPRALPISKRVIAPQYTRAQAQDPSPLQTTPSHQPNDRATSSPSSAPKLSSSSSCLTIDRDVLPGEVIKFPGIVMVKGSLESGAAIYASGDIIVLGQLEGEAHAGRNGDTNAVIFAWKLTSTTLSIAGHDAGPSSFNGDDFYKIASLSNSQIRILDASAKDSRFSPSKIASVRTSTSGLKSWSPSDLRAMRKSSKVAVFTGVYIFIVGVALLLFPESFGYFFDLQSSIKEWIRFIAVLAVVFGIYYIGTAWGDAKGYNGADSFYISTIVGRVFIFLSFSWLAANGALGLPIFVVGTVNLIGALTMLNALRKERTQLRSA